MRVDFAPGVAFARHSHPGEEIAFVPRRISRVSVRRQGCGDAQGREALFIPAGTIHTAKNVGKGNGAELATYIVEKGKPLVVLAK